MLLWWTAPHPMLVDLVGIHHQTWCPDVIDGGGDTRLHEHLAANEKRAHHDAPIRCDRCHPELTHTHAPHP